MPDSLDDDAVYDRLHRALLALGREKAETTRGQAALDVARRMLQLTQLGLIAAMEKKADDIRKAS